LFIVFVFSCKKDSNNQYGLPDVYSNQNLGASANDLLSAKKYTSINIQIQYMPGYAPDATVINNITAFLNSVCNKPGGITIQAEQIAANGADLTQSDVSIIEKQDRTAYTSGSTVDLYVLITDGADTSVQILGFAYRNTSICLFGKTIYNNSGGIGRVSRVNLESDVLEHELGHLLGLVNIGSPMQTNHIDAAHGNHCNNQDCLMYYAAESKGTLSLLGNAIPQLDANCLNDLHANGGK
jgi:hypothetical protein